MKNLFFSILALSLVSITSSCAQDRKTTSKSVEAKSSLYNFNVVALNGETFPFSKLKGKKVLIVNTASKCGLTPQYEQLESLNKKYGDKLIIVGFPSNDFAGQEPGTATEIESFCKQNYGVTFPMMDKVVVKGDNMNEVYKFLTQKSKNGLQDSEVQWNFQKYLIDENGQLVKVVAPKTLPTDPKIIAWIENGTVWAD